MYTSSFDAAIPKDQVRHNLQKQDSGDFVSLNPQLDWKGTRAAVLVPLFYVQDQLHVLLTRRADGLRTAPGEVAFPGGKRDKCDKDDITTALREAEEEIGLPQSEVEVLSRLPPLFSVNSVSATPVVAFVPNNCLSRLAPNPSEVQDVFSVPLAMFLSEKNHRALSTSWPGRFEFIHFFQESKKQSSPVIFGLTAYICICVASIVHNRDPDFQMELTFNRKDLEIGYLVAFSVLSIATHMNVAEKMRKKLSGVTAPQSSKL